MKNDVMRLKLRITLLIVLTLLLGFTIGMLTSAQLRHKRMRPVRMYASENYFRDHLYKLVEPDSIQKEKLDEIISKYGEEFNDINSVFRKELNELMDKQWNEIKPVLNKDQVERLEELNRRRREMTKEFRERGRPGDGDRHYRRPDYNKRSHRFRDSLPNPPDRKTDSL